MTKIISCQKTDRGAWAGKWLVSAPWAHPVWSEYQAMVFDLGICERNPEPPILYRDGMTHEFHLYAIDPEKKVDFTRAADDQPQLTGHLLQPPNMVYQFPAPSNEEAFRQIDEIMQAVANGTLSPDTDWRHLWDKMFLDDGVSLIKRRF